MRFLRQAALPGVKQISIVFPRNNYGLPQLLSKNQEKNIYLSELEIIEPELWIRNHPKSAESIAEAIKKIL